MVLSVWQWNIIPGKEKAYEEWVRDAIPRILRIPGVIEFRGYRPATGSAQTVVTYEFADMAAWAAWYSHEDAQKLLTELRTVTTDVRQEIWGPSPFVPKPVRPGE
ncbi:MAG: antibiotic biosynthesis monooxygenase [Anaerolineae bacterium]|jgi:antibiotic biosynthesis monooxygenase (ABM) superfamily enzyme